MVIYVVRGYIDRRSGTYDGKGSSASQIIEEYEYEADARRRAQDLVEAGPCMTATYYKEEKVSKIALAQ